MWNLLRDVKLGLRTAWRSPGYSVIAIATMALAIGANTLLFSIANPLVVRPLPIKDQNRLGWIWNVNAPNGVDRGRVSLADLLDWRAASTTFASLAGYEAHGRTLTGNGDAVRVQVVCMTANLPDVWGLRPALGRLFQDGDDAVGRPPQVILSYRYWQTKFASDRNVLNRTIMLDGQSAAIIGVMDPSIEVGGFASFDLWAPLPLDPNLPRDQRTIRAMGRLAPGVTVAQANAELGGLAQTLAQAHQATNLNWDARVVSTTVGITSPNTWIIFGLLGVVVVFVLAIACANLANLVLARVVARRQEFAVRQAIGASRLQLIRPLLVESILLGLAGGLAGLELAHIGLRVISAVAYDRMLQRVEIDGNVLIFNALLSILTPVLFSLWPALTAGRTGTAEGLQGARTSGNRRMGRSRSILVGTQVALALSLLVASGLVLQSMWAFQNVRIGLDVSRLLTFKVELPKETYPDGAAWSRFAENTTRELGSATGATSVAAVSHLPVFDAEITQTLSGTKHDGTRDNDKPFASWFSATPAFFQAAGIRLIAGRALEAEDVAASQPVAVIGRMTAEKYFDSLDDAVGRAIVLHGRGAADRTVTIVGVVADTKDSQAIRTSPQIYVPLAQWPVQAMTVLVNSSRPAGAVADVRSTMRRLDPALAISDPQTMTELVKQNIGDNRIVNGLFLGFGVLALVLAAAGLYGVISYSVGQRRREIGVRMALGAAPSSIRRMILKEGLTVTGYGIAAGLVIAFGLGRASASVLYGVSPNDPLTFTTVAGLVWVTALLAVWMPAMRAMRVDPARSLKAD